MEHQISLDFIISWLFVSHGRCYSRRLATLFTKRCQLYRRKSEFDFQNYVCHWQEIEKKLLEIAPHKKICTFTNNRAKWKSVIFENKLLLLLLLWLVLLPACLQQWDFFFKKDVDFVLNTTWRWNFWAGLFRSALNSLSWVATKRRRVAALKKKLSRIHAELHFCVINLICSPVFKLNVPKKLNRAVD